MIVTASDEDIFEYRLTNGAINKEAQRVQESLFHEKQTIIENCLFGVDINPNSVKICRLRLWIELLKNAYYTKESNYSELETLPNIDINIKCGNSLISRFALDEDLKPSLAKSKFNIQSYKSAVQTYREAKNKEEKREMETLISIIKKDFTSELSFRHNVAKSYVKSKTALVKISSEINRMKLWKETVPKKLLDDLEKATKLLNRNEKKIQDIQNNVIYNHSLEWRFEFPEVLDNEGNFVGFDVVIGNPPYVFGGTGNITESMKKFFKDMYVTGSGKINLFTIFIEKSHNLLKNSGAFSFIIPNTFLRVTSYDQSRRFYINNFETFEIADFGTDVFEDAITTSIVLIAKKGIPNRTKEFAITKDYKVINTLNPEQIKQADYVITINVSKTKNHILQKMKIDTVPLGELCKEMIFGVVITNNRAEVVKPVSFENAKPFLEGDEIGSYYIAPVKSYLNYDPTLLHRARTKEIFEVPEKLLIQRITGGSRPLKVAYDNKQYYNKESINNLILKEGSGYNIKFILTLLNSKLINWFYTHAFTNESKLTVNLSKTYLARIPIKNCNDFFQQTFVSLANNMLEQKEYNKNANTINLEKQIDDLVYKLYNLTPEEIQIIENSVK